MSGSFAFAFALIGRSQLDSEKGTVILTNAAGF